MQLTGRLARADVRLAASRPLVVALLVAVSIALRAIYFAQADGTPLLDQHRSKASDMHFFDRWAQRIASGDLLVDEPFHPFQKWHDDLALQHFAGHPEERASLIAGWRGPVADTTASRLLWQRWYGGTRFHQEPLYPYLLGASYAVFGADVRPMLWLQMAAGVLGNVLVYLVARRAFGDLVGTTAGVLALLCGPLLYYELLLLRDSLVATVGLGLVHLVQRAEDRPTRARWAAVGLGFGAALLLKSSLALFLGAILIGAAWAQRHHWRELAVRLGVALAVGALILAPAVARNLAVGAPSFGLSSVGAITFVCANAADYGSEPGFAGEFTVSQAHAARILGATNGEFVPAALAAVGTHEGIGSYLWQVGRKLGVLLWWYEVPNNASFDYFALHAPILRALPVTFLWIGPLGLVGLGLAAPRWRALAPLYALLATTLVIALAFGVFSRLRLPFVPPLAPFAALALVTLAQRWQERRFASLVATFLAIAPLLAIAARPLPEGRPRIRVTDYTTPYVTHTKPRVEAALARNAPCDAAAAHAALLATEPEAIRVLDGRRPAAHGPEEALARFFRRVHDEHAAALGACGAQESDAVQRAAVEAALEQARRRVAELDRSLSFANRPR